MATERTPETMQAVHQQLESYLHERGLRLTAERTAIVDAIYEMDSHFSIEQLNSRLEEQKFRVALATLYNNMIMLVEAGLVWAHNFGSAMLYEASYDVEPHYHCICRDCGSITNLYNDRLTSRLQETRIKAFSPDFAYIYIYGVCTKCKAARTRKEKKRLKALTIKR